MTTPLDDIYAEIEDLAYQVIIEGHIAAERVIPQLKSIFKQTKDLPILQKALLKRFFEQHIVYEFSPVVEKFFKFLVKDHNFKTEDILECLISGPARNIAYMYTIRDMGVDVSKPVQTEYGVMTPLMKAMHDSNHEVFQTLLKSYPDPYVETEYGSALDPTFYTSDQMNKAVRKYKKIYDDRYAVLKHQAKKRDFYDVIGFLKTEFNGKSHSYTVPFYMAQADQFFEYIKRGIPKGMEEIWGDEIGSTQSDGLTAYDILFDRHSPKEIFDIKHWQDREDKLHLFYKYMPPKFKRICTDEYEDCKAEILNQKIIALRPAPKIKRR